MKIKSALLLASALLPLAVSAGNLTFTGDTTSASAFNRPVEDGSALSGVGTAVQFLPLTFTVDTTGSYNLSLVASDPANFDTFLHLYDGSFSSLTPLAGFLAANDDAGPNPNLGSALNGFTLTANVPYTLVVDGFSNSDFGAFTASITGPGSIAPVPEPSTFALAAFGLAGLWHLRRNRTEER